MQIPIQEITEAAQQSNINSRIENLPDVFIYLFTYFYCFASFFLLNLNSFQFKKYDTIVGNKGSQLSGGEKQRIAIGLFVLFCITIDFELLIRKNYE